MSTQQEMWESFKERLSSPISGTFTIIWLIINWQVPIIIAFGDGDQTRLSSLKFFIDNADITVLLIKPAFFTMVYIPANLLLKTAYGFLYSKYLHFNKLFEQNSNADLQELNSYGATLFKINGELFELLAEHQKSLIAIHDKASEFSKDPFYGQTYKHFAEYALSNHNSLDIKIAPYARFRQEIITFPPTTMVDYLTKIRKHKAARHISRLIAKLHPPK